MTKFSVIKKKRRTNRFGLLNETVKKEFRKRFVLFSLTSFSPRERSDSIGESTSEIISIASRTFALLGAVIKCEPRACSRRFNGFPNGRLASERSVITSDLPRSIVDGEICGREWCVYLRAGSMTRRAYSAGVCTRIYIAPPRIVFDLRPCTCSFTCCAARADHSLSPKDTSRRNLRKPSECAWNSHKRSNLNSTNI